MFKSVYFDNTASIESLSTTIDKAIQNGAKSLLLFLAEASPFNPKILDQYLQKIPVPVAGGIFPQIVCAKKHHTIGAVICCVDFKLSIKSLPIPNETDNLLSQSLQSLGNWFERYANFLVFIDGLSTNIDPFIDMLYDQLGTNKSVAGGGAGSISLEQKPCLLSNQGLLVDAVQIIGIPQKLSIGTCHGWSTFAGPFLVTGTQNNTIQTLNYRPAYELYKETIESLSDKRFSNENFFSISKIFPFGMEKLNQEILIRDPIATKENALICVGQVPENTLLYIMRGEPDSLISSAGKAAAIVVNQRRDSTSNMDCVLFDCISRCLFLEDRFEEELSSVLSNLPEGATLVGALTLGEISSSSWGPIQFLNKTTIACGFEEIKNNE